MCKEAFEAAISKAIVESDFRDLLLADPDLALAGFGLTEQEMSILKKIDNETLEAFSVALDARIWIKGKEHDAWPGRNYYAPGDAKR